MARFNLRMPAPDSVAAGQTATFQLPLVNTYHELQLEYSGAALSTWGDYRLYLNGVAIQTVKMSDRDAFNQHDKLAAAAGIIKIPLERKNLKTLDGQELTSIDAGRVTQAKGRQANSFYLEVDVPAGATSPTLKLSATVSPSSGMGIGSVLFIKRHQRPIGAAGEAQISDLPYGDSQAAALNRVWFKPASGTVNKVRIEKDGVILFERSAALNTSCLADGQKNPQSGWYTIDKTEGGIGGDMIPLVGHSHFAYVMDNSAAGSMTIYSETIGTVVG